MTIQAWVLLPKLSEDSTERNEEDTLLLHPSTGRGREQRSRQPVLLESRTVRLGTGNGRQATEDLIKTI